MSEEEIIKYIKDEIENDIDTFHWFDNIPKNETRRQIEESIKAHQGILDLYNKEKEENKKLKEIIFNIRHKLKGKVISKYNNIYAPAKNLSKQEVYQTFVDISIYLEANYIFKDDETVIQDLLKIIESPIPLCLYKEDLRKLLEEGE